MRWFNPLTAWAPLVLCSSVLAKDYMIGTRSLKPCMKNSGITATYVDVAFHTNTSKLHFDINGYSAISGKVHVLATVYAYGFKVFDLSFDPCERAEWTQLCPMSPRRLYIQSNENVGEDLVAQIPSVAFQVPDLDGYVRIEIVSADEKREPLACVDALLTNGVTIEKGAVSWVTAFIAGGALFWAMVVISASNPSLHYYHLATAKYAAYSLAFFTFLQNQALIGMTSVPLPPIVSAWTQNLVWAVGIVEMDFLQTFFHWYIRSTGGQRSELFNQISATSVLVTKRDLSMMPGMSLRSLVRRELDEDDPQNYEHITVKGIERVAFKANIEQTNLFLTSYSMYILFVTVVVILFLVFRGLVELMARKRVVGMDNRLTVFREHWKIILKKIAFCLVIIGFPALIALSLWEITMKDSPAAVVLAVIIFLVVTILMAQAVLKLYMLLRRTGVMPFSAKGPLARFSTKSAAREKPAFTSWRDSDPGLSEAKATASRDLKQFTILTIPYRRSGAYWVLPLCLFVFTKSALIGLSQQHLYNAPGEDESSVGTVKGTAQAIGFLVMDLLWLIGVAWVRPWMDKPTNILGVASAAVGLVNAVCLLIFTEVIHGQAVS
ncbi:hypothetical protein BDZ91DRAFT_771838 [Kalaharituber pfeilii]|nr:hypothetical protein BDZ91DRAFT_771838 [Kalaharituber pfeilii]